MIVKEEAGSGSQDKSKLFWWPCPNCRLWHQTRVAEELLTGDTVEVRCPVSGRTVERPVPHRPRRPDALVPPPRAGFFRRLFGR